MAGLVCSPFQRPAALSAKFLATAIINPILNSATATLFRPGVYANGIPAAFRASLSTVTGVPFATPMNFIPDSIQELIVSVPAYSSPSTTIS